MEASQRHLETLVDLEARHDELLRQLEALDRQVEKVLADCGAARQPTAGSLPPVEPSRLVDRPPQSQPEGDAERDPHDPRN